MQKADERFYVLEFLKLATHVTASGLVDSEGPDFLCDVAGELTGIEVTRFFFPSAHSTPPQAIAGYRRKVSEALIEEHRRRAIPAVHVSVHTFRDGALCSSRSRRLLIDRLLDHVSSRIPSSDTHSECDYDTLPIELQDLGVQTVRILKHAKLTIPFWSFPYASFVPRSSAAQVQSILTKKEEKVAAYRSKADRMWLLILSGTDGLHSIIDLEGDVLEAVYATGFDRVFLFRTCGSSVHELKKTA